MTERRSRTRVGCAATLVGGILTRSSTEPVPAMSTAAPSRPAAESIDWRPIALLILALSALRLAIAALLPVTQDEAYYFDWARTLGWGYFDHPPGVAALGLGTLLEPGSALAARLGTLLAGVLTLVVLARLYWRAGLTTTATLASALLLACATLPGLIGGVVTTPDTVLALAWALALHESERALGGERRRWITAGIAVGIGLLGKYTMVLIGPVLLWAILWVDPRALRTRWPYLGALAALLVFAPNLWWNASHDWLSLGFQLGHGLSTELAAPETLGAGTMAHSGPQTLVERLASLGGYLGAQLAFWGLLVPVLVMALRGGGGTPPRPRLTRHARALLIAATLFPLGFFAVIASFSEVEANWPVVYLLAAPALLAPRLLQRPRWLLGGAGANLVLVTLYAVHAASAALPLPDSANRVLRETHGFAALAEVAAGLDAPVHADRYQLVAMLRFHAPGLAATTSQWPGLHRPSEYLHGRIAPRLDPARIDQPFWLVSRAGHPPALPGFRVTERRVLQDCAGQPLHQGASAPCARPLHIWRLYRYAPLGD
ncbi:glycosyltransferase [Marichromatium sp. AB32]|nr:glycosyltransferase family 39 protein [Marichromatium sp.]RNE94226.1 glycosyltransferase [Marichromatium sp. AB32]